MKRIYKIAALFSLFLVLIRIGPAYGADAQSNFQIMPPPLGYPTFEEGVKKQKVGLIYLNMSGSGIDLTGYGADTIFRKVLSDKMAINGTVGAVYMNGTINVGGMNADLSLLNIPLSFNVEYQPYKTPTQNFILFAGPLVSLSAGEFDMNYTAAGIRYSTTTSMTSYMYGLQGGGQYSHEIKDFRITPFLLMQYQQGSTDSSTTGTYSYKIGNTTYTNYISSSSSYDIPGFTTITYGFDVMYVPWGLTLSSILQDVGKSGDNQGFKTTMFIVGWNF